MKMSYWMLGVFTFLALFLLCFILYPITSILIGLLMGFIAIYRGFSPDAGTLAITWSSATWKGWWFFLPAIFALTIAFVLFTRFVHSSKRFGWIRARMNRNNKAK